MSIIKLRTRRKTITCCAAAAAIALLVAGCRTDQSADNVDATTTQDTLEGAELVGWWVVDCETSGGSSIGGSARGEILSSGNVQLDIELADGRTPQLIVTPGERASLAATWDGAATTLSASTEVPPKLSGQTADCETLTVYPAERFTGAVTGSWTRRGDDKTVIVASDVSWGGYTVAMSVLDEDGDWPEDYRYRPNVNLTDPDDPRASDVGATALLFDEGRQLYACLYDWPNDVDRCDVLEKATAQSPKNGIWLGGVRDTQYSTPTEWEATVLVEHEGTLYVHYRVDSFLDSPLWHSLRAVQETAPDGSIRYRDTSWGGSVSADWIVRESPDGVRLIGAYEGFDPHYYYSLERTVEPPAGYLTGDASSLSLDWLDAPSGIPEPVLGSATIVQDGNQLTIVDASSDGVVYEVQATWTGHEYEGQWWLQSDPGLTSPWRGQLNAAGTYLHGTWEKGEYSFVMAPIGVAETLGQVPAGTATVSYDSFDDTFATIQDAQTDYRYVLERDQDRIQKVRVVTPQGSVIIVDVDDRMRPTRSWTDTDADGWEDEVLRFQWSADSQTLVVTDEITLAETTIPLDWSDAAMQQAITAMEAQTGQDLTEYRQWLTDNPGRLAAIMQGDEALGSILPPMLGATLVKDNHPAPWGGIQSTIVTGLALYSLIKIGIFAAGALAGSPYLLALAFSGLYVVIVFLLIMYVWFAFICDPCTLACFWNCTDQ